MLNKTRRSARRVLVCALLLSAMLASGCTRTKYRLAADREVRGLILEKSNDPRWQLKDYTIKTNPLSRYFDPTCPDRPPMPEDDPASHRYMHCVDGKKGWPCWHVNGDRRELENPRW